MATARNRMNSTELSLNVGDVVIPGDNMTNLVSKNEHSHVIIGPGLRRFSDSVLVIKCGIIRKKEQPETFWIDSCNKRYVPVRGEVVIGIITGKTGDTYMVDIGSSDTACLSYLAFESATKKNRPTIQVGDLVYARLLVASKDMEPELICVDSYGKKQGLGPLTGGFMFTVGLHHVRKLLSSSCPLLKALGDVSKYEIAIGMNGRVWVNTTTSEETITIANIISSQDMNPHQLNELCPEM